VRVVLRRILSRVKRWDIDSSRRPDVIATVSCEVQARIRAFYGRDAEVIHPGVNCGFFTPGQDSAGGDYYLVVSRLKPYKRIDIVVDAFNRSGKRLIVIGNGSEGRRLRRRARGNIRFLGRTSDDALRDHYRRCQALIFPTHEDFGLTPLEAQACGRPVIAYGRGGALETVAEGRTGIFFNEQTPQSLAAAIERFEAMQFDPAAIRSHACEFDQQIFIRNLMTFIERAAANRAGAAA
jgi:glycosyltransferase involved in cell wall biosynthesis